MSKEEIFKLAAKSPKEHFNAPECSMCDWKYCDWLRYGGVYPGKFFFVRTDDYGSFTDCPFSADNFEEIEQMLLGLSFTDLDLTIGQEVIRALTPIEQYHYNHNHFVNGFNDVRGRIEFTRYLYNNSMIKCIRIPFGYKQNQKMAKWLHAIADASAISITGEYWNAAEKDEEEDATAALARELERVKPELLNPKWLHIDEQRRKESPKTTSPGDNILLMTDIQNIAQGARVKFEVFDKDFSPPKIVGEVEGKVEGSRAHAEWTVKEKEKESDNGYDFQAVYKDKKSGVGKIEVEEKTALLIRLNIDPEDPDSQDDRIRLFSEDKAKSYEKILTVKDDKIKGDNYLDLEFTNLKKGLTYTLEVDPGAEGEIYYPFTDQKIDSVELKRPTK